MDVRIASSTVLVVTIALMLGLVGSVVRSTERPAVTRPHSPDLGTPKTTVRSTMTSAQNTKAAPAKPLRVRWGRVALALTGLAGLGCFAVVGLLALFGVASGAVSLLGLAVFAGVIVSLRALAVQDRRRRVLDRINRTYAEAMEAAREQSAAESARVAPTGGQLFDGQPAAKAPQRPSVEELRAEARKVAAASSATAGLGAKTWTPVDVPRPTYVDAPQAKRTAPAPLERPEQPKAQHVTSILADTRAKAAAEAANQSDSARVASAASQPEPALAGAAMGSATAGQRRLNLDDVLQRRRGA